MEAFLNEQSLHEQYADLGQVADAIACLNRVLLQIAEKQVEKRVFFDRGLYLAYPLATQMFSSCLTHIRDKSVRVQFKRLMRDRLGAEEWNQERIHENDDYLWNNLNLRDRSAGELSERSLQMRRGFLISFQNSMFGSGAGIEVRRADGATTILYSVVTESDFRDWCAQFPDVGPITFDAASNRPPLDRETVLRDRGRFSKTSYMNQGRSVFVEKQTGRYFCIDNLHVQGAHIEVFDGSGRHLGEASLDGEVDATKADPTKSLAL